MPTITRTTTGMMDPWQADVKSTIATAKANFVADTVISASHINSLLSVWRRWNDHYHETADYAFEAYGNTASTGTFYDTNPENTGRLGGTEPADVAAGDIVTSAKHEEIRSAVLGANDHTHTIDDRVY